MTGKLHQVAQHAPDPDASVAFVRDPAGNLVGLAERRPL